MDKELKNKFLEVQRIIEERVNDLEVICWIWHLMSNFVKAYRHFDESTTSESEALARWEIEDARADLVTYLYNQGFASSEILDFVRLVQLAR